MSEIQLNNAFFQKAAGWEVVQHARALLGAGKVLSSNWTAPVLKGVVQAGEITYRAGLVIRGVADIDNLCTCRPSREDGILCAHSVAVGLHHLEQSSGGKTGGKPGGAQAKTPTGPTRTAVRLPRADAGTPLQLQVIFPPNFIDSLLCGKVTLVFEGITSRGRAPLNALTGSGPFRLDETDSRLLEATEQVTGDTPGMCQLSGTDFARLLPMMAGHPRLTLGRQQSLQITTQPFPLSLKVSLEANGEITLNRKMTARVPTFLPLEGGVWAWTGHCLQPLGLADAFREVLQKPIRLSRAQVPLFLSQDWPRLDPSTIEANFKLEDFEFSPSPPRFILNLSGGLAQLTATLQCAYGSRIMTVGVTAAGESAWLPDPSNPRRYSTRDPGAEHKAYQRLRNAGFSGPNGQGQWQLMGQDRVVAFFAREFYRMEQEWQVSLEERLERSTQNNLERITPAFRVTTSGEQWFDLEVNYSTPGGERFSPADIQQLLRGGGTRRLKNGKIAILDSGAVEEFQQVLLDCAPDQRQGQDGTQYRMTTQQAGFLDGALREHGFALQAPVAWQDRAKRQRGELKLECPPLGSLENTLRPYQKQGVAWLNFLRENGFGGILADEMGLGKTLQVLTHVAHCRSATQRSSKTGTLPQLLPTLVICPTSLVFNWSAEAARWTPELKTLVLDGPNRHQRFDQISQADLIITSYALVRRDAERYRDLEFDTVILDEAQHIKNRQTQNAQAVKSIRTHHRLVLTGTPLENSVLDLWSIYDFLMPGYLGSATDFKERYEVPIAREKDVASMSRLAKRVRPFLLRRLKRDVVKDLPAKLEQVSFCDLNEDQAALYQQLLAHTRKEVHEAVGDAGLAKSRMLILTALLRLRQVCCDLRLLEKKATPETSAPTSPGGKLQLFCELLDEILDGGHRVLVFSQFTSMLQLLQEELESRQVPFCYLDGSTSDRAGVVGKFQQDPSIPVFLISLKAGGVGLNLTGADTVIHFDPWWNPAVEDQATDRAHRLGQTRVVTSYKLIARGTVEEKILNLQRKKRELIHATLTDEDAFTGKLSWEDIQELLS